MWCRFRKSNALEGKDQKGILLVKKISREFWGEMQGNFSRWCTENQEEETCNKIIIIIHLLICMLIYFLLNNNLQLILFNLRTSKFHYIIIKISFNLRTSWFKHRLEVRLFWKRCNDCKICKTPLPPPPQLHNYKAISLFLVILVVLSLTFNTNLKVTIKTVHTVKK